MDFSIPSWLGHTFRFIEAHGVLIGVISAVMLLAAIPAVPWIVAQLPEDYFLPPSRRHRDDIPWHPLIHWPLVASKNALGLVLVIFGLIMLLTPGQGLLTLLVGLCMMNFPGKYRLERRIARVPGVLRAINWLRARSGRPPLQAPLDEPGS